MAVEHDGPAFLDLAFTLAVDLGDETAGGIEARQAKAGGLCCDEAGNPMRAEDCPGAARHFGESLDEAGTLGLQGFNNITIMDEFMPDIEGRVVFIECAFHDLDCTNNPGANPLGCAKITFIEKSYLDRNWPFSLAPSL